MMRKDTFKKWSFDELLLSLGSIHYGGPVSLPVSNKASEWAHYIRHDYQPEVEFHSQCNDFPEGLKEEHRKARRNILAFIRRHTAKEASV